MNKYFKKIFSVFLLLAVGTIGVVITTQSVSASNNPYFTINGDPRYNNKIKMIIEHGEVGIEDTESGELFYTYDGATLSIEVFNADGFSVRRPHESYPNGRIIKSEIITIWVDETETEGSFRDETGEDIFFFDHEEEFYVEYFRDDNKRPAISGEEFFVTNVDDKKPLSFFQSFLSAYDETDGDLTDEIYVKTDNYTQNINVLGDHKVVWGVKDYSDNEAILEAYIAVRDITKPVITGTTAVVRIGYKETYNIEAFRASLKVTDNHSSLTNADIKIKTDGYTANKNKLGTYDIVFNALDDSDNEGIFTKKIQVYDNIVPEFSGPTVISTSNNTVLTESDIRAQITAHDEIDGTITSKIKLIEDNYTGKGNKVGEYTIKYEVSDNEGNTAYHVVTINRLDKLPPVIWIEDGITIKTTITMPLTFEQIINILQVTGQVPNNSTTMFNKIVDEYEGNEHEPGKYLYTVRARATDGNESQHPLFIQVLGETDDDGVITKPPFNIVDHFKDNYIYYIVFTVLAVGVVIVIRKKK